MNLMQEELDTAMAEYDTDGSGQLEFDEFVAMVCITGNDVKYLILDRQVRHVWCHDVTL